jgi:hypothetical protein
MSFGRKLAPARALFGMRAEDVRFFLTSYAAGLVFFGVFLA